jgi:threonine synthase
LSVETAGLNAAALEGEQNPYLRYRERLDSYDVVRDGRMSDEQFVDLVSEIDSNVKQVWGRGFLVSPLIDGSALASQAGIESRLSIKVEAGGVGGSHKSRHLMGVAIEKLIAERLGGPQADNFAIASCGNAALSAAVLARALDRKLDVFVPTWADESVVTQLNDLGASINRCERRDGEAGDPCYLRFREAIAAGSQPFSVQGIDTPTTFDGARTLGWEIEEQTDTVDALYIQVGGGALATAVSTALPEARLHPVQAEGCAPLRRAWDLWAPDFDLDAAMDPDQQMMTPWEDPHSFATGILDDVTYDWVRLLQRTRASGGHPIVAPEPMIDRAYQMAHAHTDVNVCSTGTAGFAGLLAEPAPAYEHTVVLFTGIDRS